jgi:hypothetical protein
MKLANLFILFFSISTSSCFISIQKEIPGFRSGYLSLSDEEKNKINFTSQSKPHTLNAITGSELFQLLSVYDSTMVYIWSPSCSSDVCVPLFVFNQYCSSKNLEPIVVVEYVDLDKTLPQLDDTSTYYIINFLAYKSDLVNRYKNKFKSDMINDPSISISQTKGHRYFKFVRNKFVKSQIDFNALIE